MRAAAPPPTALNSDTSWGIAVIFTVRAVYSPRPPPRTIPPRMISQAVIEADPRPASRTAVPPIARAMPPAETRLPLRAVAGEFMRMSPMTKAAAPASQARRTRMSSRSISGLRPLGGRNARGSVSGALGRLGRSCLAPEHLEHPVGDDVAADDVHRRERDRDKAQDLAEDVGGRGGDDHRADEHDAVDRVRAGHQRRVQSRGHLRDHGEATQDREDEDRQRGQQLRAHAFASEGDNSFFTASLRISPSWVMVTGPAISSAGSRSSAPSFTSWSRSAEMLRA